MMKIETAIIPGPFVTEYETVSIAFEVRSHLVAHRSETHEPFVLTECPVDLPYVKDYDAIVERPADWSRLFDTSHWVMFLAREQSQCLGGAVVAVRTPRLD